MKSPEETLDELGTYELPPGGRDGGGERPQIGPEHARVRSDHGMQVMVLVS
jgi:hypothetical protein